MWPSYPNWRPQSSFLVPVAVPTAAPCDQPLACLQLNQEWLAYLVGAAMQLMQPTTWDTVDPDVQADILGRATDLLALIGTAMPCDPAPPNPQMAGTTQQACNIAGWLSNAIIKTSMQQAIQAIQNDQQTLTFGIDIIKLIPGAGLVINFMINGLNALYNAINGGSLMDYQAAVNDPTLWSRITCAIYVSIAGTGYVTAANFPAMVTAVGAVSYAHSEVISAIVAYLNNIGFSGVNALQQTGALAEYDCSGCDGGVSTGPGALTGGTLTVDDATTTVVDTDEITFVGGTVSKTADGHATVTIDNPTAFQPRMGQIIGDSLFITIPAGQTSSSAAVTFPLNFSIGLPLVVCSGDTPPVTCMTHDVSFTGFRAYAYLPFPLEDDVTVLYTWHALPGDGSASAGPIPLGSESVAGSATTSDFQSHSVRGLAHSG